MRRHILTATLLLLTLTQTACLQSVLTPAHKLDAGELVAGAALEASISPRLTAAATLGFGEADASVYGAAMAFGGDATESLFLGGGIAGRWYTPIGMALAGNLEYTQGITARLPDGETPRFAQAVVKFVSIPNEAVWLYGGPTATVPLTALDGGPLNGQLAFFGLLAGLNIPVADGAHVQLELMLRPLVFQNSDEGTRFGLLTDDTESTGDLLPLLLTGGQFNVGLNVRLASF